MSEGRRRAILMASSEFPLKDSFDPLHTPLNNVRDLEKVLLDAELGGFHAIVKIVNKASYEAATILEAEFNQTQPDDMILLYYAGHGEKDDLNELYLTMRNTVRTTLKSTSISLKNIFDYINPNKCGNIALILDCCYSGAAAKSIVSGGLGTKMFSVSKGKGVYLLTASSAFQPAEERPSEEYSLLTKHILYGLTNGDADTNQDGKVSLEDLYQYVAKQVVAEGKQEPKRWDVNARGSSLILAQAPKWARIIETSRQSVEALETQLIEIRRRAAGTSEEDWDKVFQYLENVRAHPALASPRMALIGVFVAGGMNEATFFEKWKHFDSPAASRRQEILPRRSFTEYLKGVPLEMILVPAGKFMMGSDKEDSEKPIHEVRVPSFYIGKFQVTQKQWQAVMGTTIQQQRDKSDKHLLLYGEGANYPMYYVNWQEARAFCEKLRTMTGKAFRLPSEAEWEYACRARTTGDYAGKLDEMAWYNEDLSKGSTHPVGQKKPNAFGLYDMHGNVWEWCEDVWYKNYNDAPSNGSAWTTGGNQESRVLRGGSWDSGDSFCRSADRYSFDPGDRGSNIGFRVVVSARTL